MIISVVGLGKLGAPLAAVLAESGHMVIGMDLDASTVEAINAGKAPVSEPGLQDLITKNIEGLSATTDLEEAVLQTSITFVIVPTPSLSDGSFSLEHVLKAIRGIGATIANKKTRHLVVVSSTVMPGSMAKTIAPALETAAGKTLGDQLGLCYNPEFIALGTVIRDMRRPDMVLVGEDTPGGWAGSLLEKLYADICPSGRPVFRMNFINAEITKLAINTYVTMKISYANALAEICESLPGADARIVTQAMGADTRIGSRYLQGALGYGGPCFPRDTRAFRKLAQGGGSDLLVSATESINYYQPARLGHIAAGLLPEHGTVGILGLSYKPGTPIWENSQASLLCDLFKKSTYRMLVYDPMICDRWSMEECAALADVLILAVPWPEFRSLQESHLKPGSVLIDWWGILNEKDFPDHRYIRCGVPR